MFHFFCPCQQRFACSAKKFNRARKLNWVDQKNFLKLLTEKILVKYNTEPKFASVSLVRVEKKLRLLLKKKQLKAIRPSLRFVIHAVEQFVYQYSECPVVGCEVVSFVEDNLGRSVLGGSTESPCFRVGADLLCKTKVTLQGKSYNN